MEEIKDLDIIRGEIEFWRKVQRSLGQRDGGYAYADTGDSMEIVDEMMSGNQDYQRLTALRAEISRKIMRGNQVEQLQGIQEFGEWISEVEKVIG